MDFIIPTILFLLATAFLLFLPGYCFIRAAFRDSTFTPLERFALIPPISFVLVTFLTIFIGKVGILITQRSVFFSVALLSLGLYGITWWRRRQRNPDAGTLQKGVSKHAPTKHIHTLLIILLFTLTIFIKTFYLTDTIFPTSTDLGHHTFWVQKMMNTGELPVYEKQEVETHGEGHILTDPQPISDFIIGEHLVMANLLLLMKNSVVSAFPSLFLYVVNIWSLLIIFVLVLRLFASQNAKGTSEETRLIASLPMQAAIATLLLMGPLWAISGAQAKFVSGGVIGNLLGNFLIPAALYFFYRSLTGITEKLPKADYTRKAWMLFVGIIISLCIVYTHHLSALVFGFIVVFGFVFLLLFHLRSLKALLTHIAKILFTPQVLLLFVVSGLLFVVIHTPSYIANNAVETSVGTPTKSTRTGLTPSQLMYAMGEPRFALGLIGIAIASLLGLQALYGRIAIRPHSSMHLTALALLLGWAIALAMMSLFPALLKLNIPSGRIANYAPFPFTILAGFALVWMFWVWHQRVQTHYTTKGKSRHTPPQGNASSLLPTHHLLLSTFFIILLTFVLTAGMRDNATSLRERPNTQAAVQTFHAAQYLAGTLKETDWLLKDHNYLTADAWIKIFFARDYTYPLSRSFFKRYEDPTKDREKCTLHMISTPNTEAAQQCFNDLGVTTIMVQKDEDSAQFERSDDFSKIYESTDIAVFMKK